MLELLIFYIQLNCDIAFFCFFQQLWFLCFCLFYVWFKLLWWFEWLLRSIALTRYSPDNMSTRDKTAYSQFLNPVGHDVTITASFDIPYRGLYLHCKYWLEFVLFYIGTLFVYLMCQFFDRYFCCEWLRLKFEFTIVHFFWQFVCQVFKAWF